MARKLVQGLLGASYQHRAKDILSQRFMVPPFSVLNTREGWWQDRKRLWIDIGIRSELGRGYDEEANASPFHGGTHGQDPMGMRGKYSTNATMSRKHADQPGKGSGLLRPPKLDLREKAPHKKHMMVGKGGGSLLAYYKQKERGVVAPGSSKHANHMDDIDNYRNRNKDAAKGNSRQIFEEKMGDTDPIGGTSIFDPVLCELSYRWFCPPGGLVLDPFAGGSVRGIVAGELGLTYFGIELSERQIAANQQQVTDIGTDPAPTWVNGDSVNCQDLIDAPDGFDYLFSCPPYGDLERYSDDPRDLSTLPGADFDDKYFRIIVHACQMLKAGAFATFVVGDYRDKAGFYRNLPGVTIAAFAAAGLQLYNTAILVNVTGSLPLRINQQFNGSRKLGTCHQTVLTFCKGQPKDFVRTWPAWES